MCRLQRTELIHQLRERYRERMDRPGEREIQELIGKRVKQDAPDYRASGNPAKKHLDNLSLGGRLSRAKWSCWLKCVLGDEVDRCLQHAWVPCKEWDEDFESVMLLADCSLLCWRCLLPTMSCDSICVTSVALSMVRPGTRLLGLPVQPQIKTYNLPQCHVFLGPCWGVMILRRFCLAATAKKLHLRCLRH